MLSCLPTGTAGATAYHTKYREQHPVEYAANQSAASRKGQAAASVASEDSGAASAREFLTRADLTVSPDLERVLARSFGNPMRRGLVKVPMGVCEQDDGTWCVRSYKGKPLYPKGSRDDTTEEGVLTWFYKTSAWKRTFSPDLVNRIQLELTAPATGVAAAKPAAPATGVAAAKPAKPATAAPAKRQGLGLDQDDRAVKRQHLGR